MRLDELNRVDSSTAVQELRQCCGSSRWARMMAAARPFASAEAMAATADQIWMSLDREDWLEAFAAHPRIGVGGAERAGEAKRAGMAGNAREADATAMAAIWAADEQSHVTDASRARFEQLNRDYEARFGYIFIVCATGRTGEEMLQTLEQRMMNNPDDELRQAAEEQRAITRLRLAKLLR